MSKSYSIFISHGWQDRWVASQIARRIEELGAKVYIDVSSLEKGDDIEDWIFESIEACDELLVLFTPESQKRNWLWHETGAARAFRKRMTTVLYGISFETIEKEGGATFLKAKLALDINVLEAYFIELKQRIERLSA